MCECNIPKCKTTQFRATFLWFVLAWNNICSRVNWIGFPAIDNVFNGVSIFTEMIVKLTLCCWNEADECNCIVSGHPHRVDGWKTGWSLSHHLLQVNFCWRLRRRDGCAELFSVVGWSIVQKSACYERLLTAINSAWSPHPSAKHGTGSCMDRTIESVVISIETIFIAYLPVSYGAPAWWWHIGLYRHWSLGKSTSETHHRWTWLRRIAPITAMFALVVCETVLAWLYEARLRSVRSSMTI